MVDEPGGAGAVDTGGAVGGAEPTPSGVSSDPGSSPNAITSMDQVPESMRQQIYDTAYGKTMQTAEKRFMEQYGDHIELAKMMAGQSDLSDEVLDAMMEMPGFQGRVNRAAQQIREGSSDPETQALKREVDQLKQTQQQAQQQGWVQQIQTAVNNEVGDDPVKRGLLMGRLQGMFKDQNTPNFTVEDIPKIAKEIDGQLLEYRHGANSEYIKGKESNKSKGAEGSAGTPPSPGAAEPAGEFGQFDDAFSQAVQRELESASDV